MKHNPKEIVNIVTLVEEFVTTLNKRCIDNNIPKVYNVRIINSKTELSTLELNQGKKPVKCKKLIFTVADVNTRNRVILYSLDYVANNPAKLLTSSYKRVLYRELLFNAFGMFGLDMETKLEIRESQKAIKNIENNKVTEQPLTVEDAYKMENLEA